MFCFVTVLTAVCSFLGFVILICFSVFDTCLIPSLGRSRVLTSRICRFKYHPYVVRVSARVVHFTILYTSSGREESKLE